MTLNGNFEVNDVERELNQMNFLSDLILEVDKFKYLDKEMALKHLVAVSQDSHFSEIRCSDLSKGDFDLQIKITKVCSEMSCKQQFQLGEILGLKINNMNERTDNDEVHAFANVSTNTNPIKRFCLGSKQSITRNVHLSKINVTIT